LKNIRRLRVILPVARTEPGMTGTP